MKNILVVALFLFTSSFFGQELSDKDIIKNAIEFLKVKEKNLLSDKICLKVIPNQKEKVIILLPVKTNLDPECDYCFDIDNNILVWNKSTKSIETKYTKKSEWSSDAMYLDELKIDTGLYYLNKNTRAFGIRYHYSGSSRVNPFGSNSINLYYFKNNKIIEVLNDFELEKYNGDSGGNGGCKDAWFETSKSVFIISDKLTTKFNDITVKTKLKDYSLDEDCEKEIIKKESTKNSILKFDEKQHKYVLKS
ncbi:hypothetical protein [Flavobacterium eburneipallidum]|uniref:hypothetical protein n=1 Tax=Flavobacterium eburneipallidum TaxID=3003263 RepID=UPI0022AC88C0|nr:hypothetical protein [Flavobacterium eburneipallidum]